MASSNANGMTHAKRQKRTENIVPLIDFNPKSNPVISGKFENLINIANRIPQWETRINRIAKDKWFHEIVMDLWDPLRKLPNPNESKKTYVQFMLHGVSSTELTQGTDQIAYSENMSRYLAKIIFSAVELKLDITDILEHFCRHVYCQWSYTPSIDIQILIQYFKQIPRCKKYYDLLVKFQGTNMSNPHRSQIDNLRHLYEMIFLDTMENMDIMYTMMY